MWVFETPEVPSFGLGAFHNLHSQFFTGFFYHSHNVGTQFHIFILFWMDAFPKEGSGYPIKDFASRPGTEQTFLLP